MTSMSTNAHEPALPAQEHAADAYGTDASCHDSITHQPSGSTAASGSSDLLPAKRKQCQMADEAPTPQVISTRDYPILTFMRRVNETLRIDACFIGPRLIKVAAHIVFVACGLESLQLSTSADVDWATFRPVTPAQFACLQPQHDAVQKLALVMGETPEELLRQAAAFLAYYDNGAASTLGEVFTLTELDAEVAGVMQLSSKYLEQLHPWPCRLVKNYEAIKNMLPDMFRSV